jgi:ribosome recycling factor
MIKEIHEDLKSEMNATMNSFKKELSRIRTGRASLNILDSVRVEYYGAPTPLNQVATLNIPESRLITIQPWDSSIIGDVEKAVMKAGLGLTPNNDGKIIRIPIPPLTEERRKELVKTVKRMGEDCKVTVRNSRRGANDMLKELEKEKEISEDEMHRGRDEVQKITDEFIEKIDEILAAKETEILEI